MADVHFEIQCDAHACRIRQVDPAVETLRNGEPVSESKIRNGDGITAGQTTFTVMLEGISGLELPDADEEDASEEKSARPMAAAVSSGVELSDAAQKVMTPEIEADAFLDALTAAGLWDDAIRFLAAWLPRPQSVAWGCACLNRAAAGSLTPAQKAAVEAAAAWGATPTEELRRAAQKAAESLGGRTPAGWLAMAAFWSEGSIGPPDAPEVRAPDGMSARAVGMAVVTAGGMVRPPEQRAAVLREFVSQGRALIEQSK
jgi:hypothetical protein